MLDSLVLGASYFCFDEACFLGVLRRFRFDIGPLLGGSTAFEAGESRVCLDVDASAAPSACAAFREFKFIGLFIPDSCLFNI